MPIFLSPEKATQALHLSLRFTRQEVQGLKAEPGERTVNRKAVAAILKRAQKAGRPPYLYEALEVLEHYGFPVIPRAIARTLDQALDQGQRLGYPLALKLAIPYVVHKFDVGGVHLHLKDPEDLKQAYDQLQDLALREPAVHEGFTMVVQKMSSRGREIILGGKQDGNFGPVIVFGIGGLYVEVIGDVVLRVAPINRAEARSMIEEIKGIKLLQGVRGQKQSDLEAIVDMVIRLSDLLTDFPQIAEIDINPVMVYEAGSGGQVLDARMVLEE